MALVFLKSTDDSRLQKVQLSYMYMYMLDLHTFTLNLVNFGKITIKHCPRTKLSGLRAMWQSGPVVREGVVKAMAEYILCKVYGIEFHVLSYH